MPLISLTLNWMIFINAVTFGALLYYNGGSSSVFISLEYSTWTELGNYKYSDDKDVNWCGVFPIIFSLGRKFIKQDIIGTRTDDKRVATAATRNIEGKYHILIRSILSCLHIDLFRGFCQGTLNSAPLNPVQKMIDERHTQTITSSFGENQWVGWSEWVNEWMSDWTMD